MYDSDGVIKNITLGLMDLFSTLPTMIQHMVNSYQTDAQLNYSDAEGGWSRMSTGEFAEQIRRFCLGLHQLGLRPGDTVGILASPSPHWLIADLATISAGGVSVPLFPNISKENFRYEIENANVKYLVVIGVDHWTALSGLHDMFDQLITLDVGDDVEPGNVIPFDEVLKLGDAVSRRNPSLYAELREAIHEDDLATIIYTSGSTGKPKGVELTHRNMISQVRGCHIRLPTDPSTDRILSVLPLAHVFERMMMYAYLSSGAQVYILDDMKKVLDRIQSCKPTVSSMVPLILEKIHSRIGLGIASKPWPLRPILRYAMTIAEKPPRGLFRRLMLKVFDPIVYRKVRQAMGGHYRGIVVGGAPLKADLCRFFGNCGIELLQGYGLTECSPVISTNFPDHNKCGTVGKIFPGVEVRIDENSEVWARGPNIMRGYHKDPEATDKRIDGDGWLRTGDLGKLDDHGYLTITGRKREMMKTSGGKMVIPVPLEQMLSESLLVDLAMVVADGRNHVTALLFPNFEELTALKERHNMVDIPLEKFVESKPVRVEIQHLLKKVNDRVNSWEQVRNAKVVVRPLSVAEGEMTPTMKISRTKVSEKYQELIDSMYQ